MNSDLFGLAKIGNTFGVALPEPIVRQLYQEGS